MPKISALPTGTSLLGTEIMPIVQSATTKSFTAAQVKAASPFVNGADIYTPLTAAIAALGSNGGIIDIPAGTYTCSDTIQLTKPVQLRGAAGFGNIATATKITWASNKTGIRVLYPFQGIGSVISGIALFSAGGSTGHGILMEATASVDNCQINSFPQDGIHVSGDVGGSPASNSNGFYLARTTINSCGGHGVFTSGGDANAGVGILITILDCGGWGIYDDGFLGNTWVACQTDSNGTGAYTTTQVSARSTYFGCYSEGNQNASNISQWSGVFGGLHAAGIIGNCFYQINDSLSDFNQTLDTGVTISYGIGASGGVGGTMAKLNANSDYELDFMWWNASTGCWEIRHAALDARVTLMIPTTGNTLDDESAAAVPPGHIVLPQGYWIPTATAGVYRQVTGNQSRIELKDGVTAPATQAGYAQIYVDTADGDLKVKFGDGTVKTIVVDT